MKNKHFFWVKLIPLLVLLLGLGAFFYFRLYQYVNLETLKQYRDVLLQWTVLHPVLVSVSFMIAYTLAVAITMPNAVLLTLLGGFLFGPFLGTLYVVISATLGATIIFLAAKTALHDWLYNKAGKWIKKISDGFQNDAVSYMLFLRLVPLFPFWLVNIVPAFLGIRLKTFFWTTLVGIIPGTFVFVLLGHGLGTVFAQGQNLDFTILYRWEILTPLLGLAVLSLVPIIYKKITGNKKHDKTN